MSYRRTRIKQLFLLAAAIIVLMALANNLFESDVHEWRNAGKCIECHSSHSDDEVKDGLTIPPPKMHTEQFRRYTHGRGGRGERFSYQRCASCHMASECRACHNTLPASHTGDFVKPRGSGMERHIMLATIRPSSCLTCHESFVTQCVTCHTPAEVKPWEARAKDSLGETLVEWTVAK